MDTTSKLLAALRRVRNFPSYHSFMAEHERHRIKRDLQLRLLQLRRQRQRSAAIHHLGLRARRPFFLRTLFH
ncbi:MAG: hypothetical protein ACP5D5_05205 [Acidithiobacillus sp.]|uniref:hypothetical protein n=1 Tax=Acidithiobacillus sp. TaxID=1872118 RepID=UPI0025B95851|nr:hypothetical protein [Acidithiobacillus sp.]